MPAATPSSRSAAAGATLPRPSRSTPPAKITAMPASSRSAVRTPPMLPTTPATRRPHGRPAHGRTLQPAGGPGHRDLAGQLRDGRGEARLEHAVGHAEAQDQQHGVGQGVGEGQHAEGGGHHQGGTAQEPAHVQAVEQEARERGQQDHRQATGHQHHGDGRGRVGLLVDAQREAPRRPSRCRRPPAPGARWPAATTTPASGRGPVRPGRSLSGSRVVRSLGSGVGRGWTTACREGVRRRGRGPEGGTAGGLRVRRHRQEVRPRPGGRGTSLRGVTQRNMGRRLDRRTARCTRQRTKSARGAGPHQSDQAKVAVACARVMPLSSTSRCAPKVNSPVL